MTDELKPVAFLIERLIEPGYGRPRKVIDAAIYDARKDSFWMNQEARDKHKVTDLVAIPPTHRVVSADLLREAMTASYLSNPDLHERLADIIKAAKGE